MQGVLPDKQTYRSALLNEEQHVMVMEAIPYQTDLVSASLIYLRYKSGNGNVEIIKRALSGTVWTATHTYAKWSARTTATYVPIDIDVIPR